MLDEDTQKRALRAVALQFLVNGAVISSYIPRLPEIRDAFGVDLSVIGWLLTFASFGGLLGSWLSGRVMTKFGTRKAMIVGTTGLIILLPLVAVAPTVWALLLILAGLMLVDVIVDVAMNIQGSNLSAQRDKPVMSRLHGLWSIGSVLGGLLAAGMAALAVPLWLHLSLASLLMLLALLYIGGGLLRSDQVELSPEQQAGAKVAKTRTPVSLWLFALLGAVTYVPEMVSSDWAAFRLKDDLGVGVGAAGMGYVAFTIGMVCGRLSGDELTARLGKQRLFDYALIVAGIGLALACLVDYVLLTYISLTLAGLGISVLFPALYDAAAQDAHRPGAALGAMTAGSRSIMLIAPASLGFLAATSWFSVGMAMAIMALPCLWLIGIGSRRIGR